MGKAYSLIVWVGCLLVLHEVAAHPSHDSFTEIEWSNSNNQLEVSMRIIPEALEEALEQTAANAARIALENPHSKARVQAYLQRHFEVRNADSELMSLKLVGMDINYAESWLYFTVDADPQSSLWLRHSVLMEVESQQVNRVQRLWRSADDIQLYTSDKPERLLWQGG